jgi:hypothetical protein
MKLIGADIFVPEQIGRLGEMLRELGDRADVKRLRARREAADRHVVEHALA